MEYILVSACLLGEPVRYDGSDKRFRHEVLQRWLDEVLQTNLSLNRLKLKKQRKT